MNNAPGVFSSVHGPLKGLRLPSLALIGKEAVFGYDIKWFFHIFIMRQLPDLCLMPR